MNQSISIGDNVICNIPMQHTDAKLMAGLKCRPAYVYGIHYGINGTIRALEVITSTASNKKRFALHYAITEGHPCYHDVKSYIISSRIFLIPYTPSFFPYAGNTARKLDKKEIPDIIARRTHGIVNDQVRIYNEIFNSKETFSRKGFILSKMKENVAELRRSSLDIGDNIAKSHIEHIQPDIIDAANVDQIALWAYTFSKQCMKKSVKIKWPEPGTWPNWPDIKDGNGNMISCVSPERKEELLATPEIISPKVTVDTKPTAAQERLKNFAGLKF